MIDKNGKKIIAQKDVIDKDFSLAEIKFLLKNFKKENTDVKAERLAIYINKYIQAFEETEETKEAFSLLENYIDITKNDSFVWEMVYIVRRKAKKTTTYASRGMFYSKSASYFNRICLLKPTVYNLCCRVLELIISSSLYFQNKTDLNSMTISSDLLSKANSFFKEIKDNNSLIYSETGLELYRELYLQTKEGNETKHHILKEFSRFSRDTFYKNSTYENLEQMVSIYCQYYYSGFFSLDEEADNIKKLIDYIEKLTFEEDINSLLLRLKYILIKG